MHIKKVVHNTEYINRNWWWNYGNGRGDNHGNHNNKYNLKFFETHGERVV